MNGVNRWMTSGAGDMPGENLLGFDLVVWASLGGSSDRLPLKPEPMADHRGLSWNRGLDSIQNYVIVTVGNSCFSNLLESDSMVSISRHTAGAVRFECDRNVAVLTADKNGSSSRYLFSSWGHFIPDKVDCQEEQQKCRRCDP